MLKIATRIDLSDRTGAGGAGAITKKWFAVRFRDFRITALLEEIATSDAFYRVTEQSAPAETVRSASNNDPAAQERGS